MTPTRRSIELDARITLNYHYNRGMKSGIVLDRLTGILSVNVNSFISFTPKCFKTCFTIEFQWKIKCFRTYCFIVNKVSVIHYTYYVISNFKHFNRTSIISYVFVYSISLSTGKERNRVLFLCLKIELLSIKKSI